jgi:hypothetical protein
MAPNRTMTNQLKSLRKPRFRHMTKGPFCHIEKVGRNTVNVPQADSPRFEAARSAETSDFDVMAHLSANMHSTDLSCPLAVPWDECWD